MNTVLNSFNIYNSRVLNRSGKQAYVSVKATEKHKIIHEAKSWGRRCRCLGYREIKALTLKNTASQARSQKPSQVEKQFKEKQCTSNF